MIDSLTLTLPDDWHAHLRDGELLRAVLPATAAHFGRAIAMPNLVAPVVTAADGRAYRQRILDALPPGAQFEPLIVGYLTDTTQKSDVLAGFAEGTFLGMKLYPAHATTHSAAGVSDIGAITSVLEAMASVGMPLLVHAEVTDPDVDVFDREAVFVDRVLAPLHERLPTLPVVLEHVTSTIGVAWVQSTSRKVAATITPHHLLWTRNVLFAGGLRPHCWCLPVVKTAADRQALREAACSGDPRFFLGTDSAPHVVAHKERDGGAAGVFNAPTALSAYAMVFDEMGALPALEAFASQSGPAFYGLQPNPTTVTLTRQAWTAPSTIGGVRVFLGGEQLPFTVQRTTTVRPSPAR